MRIRKLAHSRAAYDRLLGRRLPFVPWWQRPYLAYSQWATERLIRHLHQERFHDR